MDRKRILVLGSTGSIGVNTLRVVDNLPDELEVSALAARSSWEVVAEQAKTYRPSAVAMTDESAAEKLEAKLQADGLGEIRVYAGDQGLVDLVRETEGEVLVAAISGAAGLPANLAALDTGKDIALANKESLVMSGSILMRRAQERGRVILPVDSEHSAIFQCMLAGRQEEIRSIILTASGGPFRESTLDDLRQVTPAQALKHPTWTMGAKITIDSATLFNKSLEVIEARWLFDIPPEQIRVVVHPQSIVHSMVEYRDGSTICHVGPPDMKVPIQYALTYPRRENLEVDRLDWGKVGQLTFQDPDKELFPSLRMAYEVLETGGTAPSVFNAANEVAVAAFLDGAIPFLGIFETVEATLGRHTVSSAESDASAPDSELDAIFDADAWARDEARRLIGVSSEKV